MKVDMMFVNAFSCKFSRYHEVESSLSRDILKVEQLCDTLKRILSQQNTRQVKIHYIFDDTFMFLNLPVLCIVFLEESISKRFFV